MIQSLKETKDFTITTTDGTTGYIKDFLFDEKLWMIRYIEADFGSLFKSKKVLIPRVFLGAPSLAKKQFPVELGISDIDQCPDLDHHLPVSRKYEDELHRHYGLYGYWTGSYYGSFLPPRSVRDLSEEDLDSLLRSFNEVKGYYVHATDGHIGHIDDLLIEENKWQISYLVADTSNWVPWSKKVILSVNWLESISYVLNEVRINLETEKVKNAPEYRPNMPFDDHFQGTADDFFSRSLVK